jgi:hypothetical protein
METKTDDGAISTKTLETGVYYREEEEEETLARQRTVSAPLLQVDSKVIAPPRVTSVTYARQGGPANVPAYLGAPAHQDDMSVYSAGTWRPSSHRGASSGPTLKQLFGATTQLPHPHVTGHAAAVAQRRIRCEQQALTQPQSNVKQLKRP